MTASFALCCARAASGHGRAAEQRDEIASPHVCAHSINSSARAMSCRGTSMPSAF
jgi:hypothetical protein